MDLFTPSVSSHPIGNKEVIFGLVPSKSNQNRIIKFKKKGSVPSEDREHLSLATSGDVKKYEKMFMQQCVKYRNKNIETYFRFEVDVYYPNRRSDLDGAFKVIFDCLQKVNAIKNDSLCTEIVARKWIDKANPRIEFTLNQI